MNILIADLDKGFTKEIEQAWTVPDVKLFFCNSEDDLMPLVKKTPVDLAFIEVPFLTIDSIDMVSFLKEKNPGTEEIP